MADREAEEVVDQEVAVVVLVLVEVVRRCDGHRLQAVWDCVAFWIAWTRRRPQRRLLLLAVVV